MTRLNIRQLAQFDIVDRCAGKVPAAVAEVLFGLACTLGFLGLRFGVDVVAPTAGPYALIYPSTLISTLFGRWRSGLITFVTTFLWAWYFLLKPVHSFQFASAGEAARTAVNATAVLVVLVLADLFRRAVRSGVHQRDDALRHLQNLNAELEHKVLERTQARSRTWQVSPDLLGALNEKGYFETSNPAWMTALGWTEEEVAATSIWELLHPDDLERTRDGFNLTQIGQPAIHFPNRYRRKDGTYRWISWVGVPEDGLVYCSGRDITAQVEAEAALATAEDALRQAQKMEAVGQLTGGIAHDFNNLLAGISGSLELMQKRIAEGRTGEIGRFIAAAEGACRRAATLTQRLLAFSRRQTLDPRPTDINRLIAGMDELIRRSLGPDVELEVVGADGLWITKVDPSQLENALLNLCINARDAMVPDGGRVTIETANSLLDDRSAQERDLPPGQYVSLSVTDTGAGMDPSIIGRVFDPFFTTKPLGEGTGLGLSMVYGFVRQSGGQIRIQSELGEGTTLSLYLPRHVGEAEDGEAVEVMSATAGAGETVLVVDDEPTIRMVIVEVLREYGYRALEASDATSAMKILDADGRIDLLVTDVGLPGGMNGRQIADAARLQRPGLKVLFITGYAESAAIESGQVAAGMDVVTKPFAVAALGAKISELIGRPVDGAAS